MYLYEGTLQTVMELAARLRLAGRNTATERESAMTGLQAVDQSQPGLHVAVRGFITCPAPESEPSEQQWSEQPTLVPSKAQRWADVRWVSPTSSRYFDPCESLVRSDLIHWKGPERVSTQLIPTIPLLLTANSSYRTYDDWNKFEYPVSEEYEREHPTSTAEYHTSHVDYRIDSGSDCAYGSRSSTPCEPSTPHPERAYR